MSYKLGRTEIGCLRSFTGEQSITALTASSHCSSSNLCSAMTDEGHHSPVHGNGYAIKLNHLLDSGTSQNFPSDPESQDGSDPQREMASCTASTQNWTSMVFDNFQANTLRLYQSTSAQRYSQPLCIRT